MFLLTAIIAEKGTGWQRRRRRAGEPERIGVCFSVGFLMHYDDTRVLLPKLRSPGLGDLGEIEVQHIEVRQPTQMN